MIKSLDTFLREIDEGDWAVISSATDYPENWVIPDHSHEKHQLLYATEGVMVVRSAHNQWTVPPHRGFWMPSGHVHSLRCVGALKMRSVFVRPGSFPNLPSETKAVSISALLSELIKASVSLKPPYAEDSRDARIMHLILDELALLPALPLSLPQPADSRIQQICAAWQHDPGDASTVADWSARLALDQKTIQRLFRKDTGMTFGQWRQMCIRDRASLVLEHTAVSVLIVATAHRAPVLDPFFRSLRTQFAEAAMSIVVVRGAMDQASDDPLECQAIVPSPLGRQSIRHLVLTLIAKRADACSPK